MTRCIGLLLLLSIPQFCFSKIDCLSFSIEPISLNSPWGSAFKGALNQGKVSDPNGVRENAFTTIHRNLFAETPQIQVVQGKTSSGKTILATAYLNSLEAIGQPFVHVFGSAEGVLRVHSNRFDIQTSVETGSPLMVSNLVARISKVSPDVVVVLDIDFVRSTFGGANGPPVLLNGIVSSPDLIGRRFIVTMNSNTIEALGGIETSAVWRAFAARSNITNLDMLK